MPTITEIAQAAEREQNERNRESRERERRSAYDNMVRYWDTAWGWAADAAPDVPAYDSLGKRMSVASDDGRYGPESRQGWIVPVDGVQFLYCTDYGQTGLRVIVTCPDCGQRRAVNFYGAANLAAVLRIGRDPIHHTCDNLAVKRLRAAAQSLAKDANTDVASLVEMSFPTEERDR